MGKIICIVLIISTFCRSLTILAYVVFDVHAHLNQFCLSLQNKFEPHVLRIECHAS